MSRSRRRTPIRGHGGNSESWDKGKWHRRFRIRARHLLRKIALGQSDADDHLDAHFRDVSNRWSMAKDGKGWWGEPHCRNHRYDRGIRSWAWPPSHYFQDVRDCEFYRAGICDCSESWERMMRK